MTDARARFSPRAINGTSELLLWRRIRIDSLVQPSASSGLLVYAPAVDAEEMGQLSLNRVSLGPHGTGD